MSCLCGTTAGTIISCLRRYLGVGAGPKWDEAAHRAMYERLSTMINVQSTRGQTAEQIRAVPYGSESEITGIYAGNFATRYILAGDVFWACMGVGHDEAAAQASAGSGPYYDAMVAVMNHVRQSEDGTEDKASGVPWWLWLLGGLAAGAGVYLVVRE